MQMFCHNGVIPYFLPTYILFLWWSLNKNTIGKNYTSVRKYRVRAVVVFPIFGLPSSAYSKHWLVNIVIGQKHEEVHTTQNVVKSNFSDWLVIDNRMYGYRGSVLCKYYQWVSSLKVLLAIPENFSNFLYL